MKKKHSVLRKVLAVALSTVILLGMCFTVIGKFIGINVSVNAETVYSYGNFIYIVKDNDTISIERYENDEEKNVIIPNIINGKIVTSIGSNAFEGHTNLVSISIPNSVTSIGSNAFEGCTNLVSVSIPNSVTSISSNAFKDCTNLISISISENIKSISSNSFSNTGWYNNQDDGLVYIGNVLYKYKGIIPNNTELSIPYGVTLIAAGAFEYCKGLTSISIPESVNSICGAAFSGCTGLISITIPDNVTSIVQGTFDGCTGLTSLNIGAKVVSMNNYAFRDCTNLRNINVSKDNTVYLSYNGVVFNKSGTNILFYPMGRNGSYAIPNSVTSIGDAAFYNCTGLTDIIIPDSVKK